MVRERAWLFAQLSGIPGLEPIPSHVNFFLVRVTSKKVCVPMLVHTLAHASILIRDCANFHGLGKQFFRIAVRTRAENKRLLSALRAALVGKG